LGPGRKKDVFNFLLVLTDSHVQPTVICQKGDHLSLIILFWDLVKLWNELLHVRLVCENSLPSLSNGHKQAVSMVKLAIL